MTKDEKLFQIITENCKHCQMGREDGEYIDTCRHADNKSERFSWGQCNINVCPFVKQIMEL